MRVSADTWNAALIAPRYQALVSSFLPRKWQRVWFLQFKPHRKALLFPEISLFSATVADPRASLYPAWVNPAKVLEVADCQVCPLTAKGARKPMRSGEMSNHLLVTYLPEGVEMERKDFSVSWCHHELIKDVEDVSCHRICRSSRPTEEEAGDGRWGRGKSGKKRVIGVAHRQKPVFREATAMLRRRRRDCEPERKTARRVRSGVD